MLNVFSCGSLISSLSPSFAELIPLSLNKGIITDNQGQTFVKFSSEQFSKLFASHEREREKAG
jgi:hypothetical protein